MSIDPGLAGSGCSIFAVDDLDTHIAELGRRGLQAAPVVDADTGVRLSTLTDPDGITVRPIGGFRIDYEIGSTST
jgi:glyoxylase I family protein